MRIGEVARRAGVNIETLRYYERRGLLAEPPRGPSGHRAYDEETVRFVQAIKEAQSLGFTLAEIDEYLRMSRRPGRSASEALRVRVAEKIDQVDSKIAGLQRVREDLAAVIGCACETLDHCTCGAGYLARRGVDPAAQPGEVLHVTNGDSAGGTIRRTAVGGATISWNDVLHEGPVPDVPREELRRVRAKFMSACGWGKATEIAADFERRDRHLELALAARRPVVLWFEHDLYDQLQLLEILSLVDEPESVELIVVGEFAGHPDFRGLGELTADELETLWPARQPATAEQLELARRAWDAFRSPELQPLAGDTSALPFLAAAWRRLLEELPGRVRARPHRATAPRGAPGNADPALPRVTEARRGSVPRRRLGLEVPLRPPRAGRPGGRRPPAAAATAERFARLRVAPARAHRRGPRRARRRGESDRPDRHRPPARRHAHRWLGSQPATSARNCGSTECGYGPSR